MKGDRSMKKVLGIVLTLALIVSSFSVAIFGANNDGMYEDDDNNGSSIAFYLTDSNGNNINSTTGTYTLGQDFYFKINVYATSEIKNNSLARKINIMDDYGEYDNNATNLMYKESGQTSWSNDDYYQSQNCYKFRGTKEDTYPLKQYTSLGNHTTYFKVKFNTAGKHIIEYSATCFEKNYRLISRKYIDISNNGTFKISSKEEQEQTTEKPTYTVYIDGVPFKSDIKEGGKCDLPGSGRGFYDRNTHDMFVSHFQLSNIQRNYNLYSVDQVNVSCASGANIRADGKHGIRFGSMVNVKNKNGTDITSEVLKNGGIQIGTTITMYDFYLSIFDENLNKVDVDREDPDCIYHFDVLNPMDDWPTNATTGLPRYGLCYAGVVNVRQSNLTRQFIASAYAKIEYQYYNNTTIDEYVNAENQLDTVRSICDVARRMKAAGYPGCTPAQIEVLEYYCSIPD